MKILEKLSNKVNLFLIGVVHAADNVVVDGQTQASGNTAINVGFVIPSLADILSFMIKMFFTIAGLAALLYLLLGAFNWVTSSGDKENLKKAQDKIQSAVVGLIIIVAVLAIIITLEQFVFNKKLCLGLSCKLIIPSLIQ